MPFDISKVRPADDSADAIEAALSAIAEARTDANHRLTQAAEDRARLLTEGSSKEITRAEQAAHDARLDLERLAALEPKLAEQLEQARARDQAAAEDRLVAEASEKIEAFNTWWHSEYEKHARAIAAGLELEAAARAAHRRAMLANQSLVHRLPVVAPAWHATEAGCASDLIKLPGVERGDIIAAPKVIPDVNAAYRR